MHEITLRQLLEWNAFLTPTDAPEPRFQASTPESIAALMTQYAKAYEGSR